MIDPLSHSSVLDLLAVGKLGAIVRIQGSSADVHDVRNALARHAVRDKQFDLSARVRCWVVVIGLTPCRDRRGILDGAHSLMTVLLDSLIVKCLQPTSTGRACSTLDRWVVCFRELLAFHVVLGQR